MLHIENMFEIVQHWYVLCTSYGLILNTVLRFAYLNTIDSVSSYMMLDMQSATICGKVLNKIQYHASSI